jgi:rRNA-processing protein FCF1
LQEIITVWNEQPIIVLITMRHGRAKAARKTLQYFQRTVGLQTQPYLPVLLDGCFLVALFQYKIPPSRIERVLQIKSSSLSSANAEQRNVSHVGSTTLTLSSEGIKFFVTHEAVTELKMILEKLEKQKHDKAISFHEAWKFVREHCCVLKQPKGKETLRDSENSGRTVTSNEESSSQPATSTSTTALAPHDAILCHIHIDHRVYVVATQDENLLDQLRALGTVPIMRLVNNSVLLLEQPSKSSQNHAKGDERFKWKNSLASTEKALVEVAKEQIKKSIITTSKNPLASKERRKRKAHGPNPLSCKRKQAK